MVTDLSSQLFINDKKIEEFTKESRQESKTHLLCRAIIYKSLQFYTVAVGKLNPAKLANFMEIDIYVLVACPHCSLLDSQV